jgi:hypothetical protein
MATLTMLEQATTPKSVNRGAAEFNDLTTETANIASEGLDTKSALEIARIINHEDAKVAGAVKKALPEIAIVIDTVARSLRDGGRLIYVGAGSSGRIASLDASECPPTYSTLPAQVQYIMAGGPKALRLRRQRRFARDRPARHRPPPSHPQRHRHRRLRQRPHPLCRRRRRICPRPRSQDRRHHVQP